MIMEIILTTVTLIILSVASFSDIKTREVPNWISYGLIFFGIGIRGIFALELGWEILLNGVLGLTICISLALIFYYSHQWGGGDSKLLMGMGAVIGVPYSLNEMNLLFFFIALLLLGSIYGFVWMIYEAIRKWNPFIVSFKQMIYDHRMIHLILFSISIVLAVGSFFYQFIWPMIPFPLGVFYLFIFVNAVEINCFYKKISPMELTEGDWLGEEVFINKKKIIEKKTLEMEDIKKLRRLQQQKKLNLILIKEGIPFVPSFLISYLVLLFWKDLFSIVFSVFVR